MGRQIPLSTIECEPVSKMVYTVDEGSSTFLGDSAHSARIVVGDDGQRWVLKGDDVSFVKACNEVSMLSAFERNGIPTLPPVEKRTPLIEKINDAGDDDSVRLFLPYVRHLQPLTRMDWIAYKGTEEYEKLAGFISGAIKIASKMHRRGYVHGDFQIKNIGQLRSGKMITFDLENAASLASMDIETKINARKRDLVSLLKSVRLNGLWSSAPKELLTREVGDKIQEYVERSGGDDDSMEVGIRAEEDIMEWLSDPERISRAIRRLLNSALADY